MLLYDGQDRRHAQDDAENHVEGDEELVKLALADVLARVVGVAEGDGDDDQDVEDEGGEQESPEPVLIRA